MTVMDTQEAFLDLMARLRAGDDHAAATLFHRFVRRLVALAARQFTGPLRAKVDVEEVVQSAYQSFFLRYERGQYDLADWDGLWGLLTIITIRKCSHRREHWYSALRDPRREARGPDPDDEGRRLEEAISREPSPLQAAVLTETIERLLEGFEPPQRAIVELSLQGYTTPEIASRLGRSRRTVRRVREQIK